MKIPKEYLSPKNYEGSRLIEIVDPKILMLKQALKDIQEKEANPILNAAEPHLKVIDPANAKIAALTKKIQEIVIKVKPMKDEFEIELEKLPEGTEEFTPKLQKIKDKIDPILKKVTDLESDIAKVKLSKKDDQDKYMAEMKKVERLDEKARLLKMKMSPLVNMFLIDKLSEFERATQLLEKNGKIYVEVIDELEEKIKSIRMANSKK